MSLKSLGSGGAVPAASVACAVLVSVALSAQTPAARKPAQNPAATPPPAAATDAALPPARQVIDRFIKAIGGRDAILSHKSMHVTGTYSVPTAGMTREMEMFTAANPDRAVQRVTIPGVGEVSQGFDGQHGWSINPMTGPMLQDGKELEQARLDADFYGELRDPKNYRSIKTVEKTTFEGRPCYKVSLARTDGSEDFDYYEVDSGLRAGSVVTRDSPMGTVTATNVEGDYRKFGNLMQATSLTSRAMGVEQKITVSTIEYDNVPAAAFDPPGQIKALIK